MASRYFFPKILNSLHLPTFFLIIGFMVFWLELYLIGNEPGKTTPLAWALFLSAAFFTVKKEYRSIKNRILESSRQIRQQTLLCKIMVFAGLVCTVFIFACAFYAALLPPHLGQEYDALNYHITIPRQHLILETFKHLGWSSADLFLLPVDFALAPFWLATTLPNKIPQFFFALGLVLIAVSLTRKLGGSSFLSIFIVSFAIVGSHGFGIQLGTAMLDLVICYLALAALESFLSGSYTLFLIEFTFFFWSKPFIPLQMILILILIWAAYVLVKRMGIKKVLLGFEAPNHPEVKVDSRSFKGLIMGFVVLSLLIAGPFIFKSLYYAGTPLFPFRPGLFLSEKDSAGSGFRSALEDSSKIYMSVRTSYGYSRSPVDFLKHLWIIAVPESGVNNRYDYPVGLPYLLFLVPFAFFLKSHLAEKRFSLLGFFIVFYWLLWWMGSHQTRFLYLPIFLMFIITVAHREMNSKILLCILVFSLSINALSVYRAHSSDFWRLKEEVLRPIDKEIVLFNKHYVDAERKDVVVWKSEDIAFAEFPAFVIKKNDAFVLYPKVPEALTGTIRP